MKTRFFLKEAAKAFLVSFIVILALAAFGSKIASVQAAVKLKTLKSVKAGNITNSYLASDAVTAEKIAENAVGWSEIASGAVGSDEITDSAVTNADISGSAAIEYSKLNLGSNITSANITDGTIVNADINSAAAISSSKINFDSTININGNVGIGTTAPSASLQVVGGIKLFTDDSGTTNGFRVLNEDGTIRYGNLIWYGDNLSLQANDPYNVVVINAQGDGITVKNSTGYVGIGTTAPGTSLEVDGIIKTKERSTATCNSSSEGGIYYDSDTSEFFGCNGSSWEQLSP